LYQQIPLYASVITLETHVDITPDEKLRATWALSKNQDKEGFGFSRFMADGIETNPQIIFASLESRNDSKIKLDAIEGADTRNFPKLNPKYLKDYFAYLTKVSPHLAKMLKDENGLEKVLRSLSTTVEGILKVPSFIVRKGTLYNLFPFANAERQDLLHPTGAELGFTTFGDAMSALKIWKLTLLMHINSQIEKIGSGSKFSRWEGPVFDLQGGLHLPAKKWYLDHLPAALNTIINTPQYLRQADLLHDYPPLQSELWPALGEILDEIQHLNQGTKIEILARDAKAAFDNNRESECIKLISTDPLCTQFPKAPLVVQKLEEANLIRQKAMLPAFKSRKKHVNNLLNEKFWKNVPDNPYAIYFAWQDVDGELEGTVA